MSEPLEEIALARLAYERWRAATENGLLPTWEGAGALTVDWWYNRVGSFLEMPWEAGKRESNADRAIRETCTTFGGIDADEPPEPRGPLL